MAQKCSLSLIVILLFTACAGNSTGLHSRPPTEQTTIAESKTSNVETPNTSTLNTNKSIPTATLAPATKDRQPASGIKPVQPTSPQLRPTPSPTNIQSSITMTQKLLYVSSAAKNILSSGNKSALELHQQAVAYLDKAKRQYDQGQTEGSQKNLTLAKSTLFKASRLAVDSDAIDNSAYMYRAFTKSVKALLKAHRRIYQEKGKGKEYVDTHSSIKKLLDHAKLLHKKGDKPGAVDVLKQAVKKLKLSIHSMRSGETLVRTLKFDSPRDEYNYELDRNKTHVMLVSLLLGEKPASEKSQKKIDDLMTQAKELKQEAETLAQQSSYTKAITKLEASTKIIIRAIRSAGIYIPG